MANAVLQCGHMMANRDCFRGERRRYKTPRVYERKKGMDLPVSSGTKEGLRVRIEGVERFEAVDEGLEGTRGMVREKDVECIQSPTWRAVRGRRADAKQLRATFSFSLSLSPGLDTPSFTIWASCLCDKLPHHKSRPLEATTRLVPSLITPHSHHVLSIHPFQC
jgi:hypothetical protein